MMPRWLKAGPRTKRPYFIARSQSREGPENMEPFTAESSCDEDGCDDALFDGRHNSLALGNVLMNSESSYDEVQYHLERLA